MFTTIEEVKALTDSDVDLKLIAMAQAIVESYIGRVESEIDNANDSMLLARATAYQSAYMVVYDDMFEQTAVEQVNQFGNSMKFRQDGVSPWVAPLAVIACQKLSWRRMRSIKTGSIFDKPSEPSGWSIT